MHSHKRTSLLLVAVAILWLGVRVGDGLVVDRIARHAAREWQQEVLARYQQGVSNDALRTWLATDGTIIFDFALPSGETEAYLFIEKEFLEGTLLWRPATLELRMWLARPSPTDDWRVEGAVVEMARIPPVATPWTADVHMRSLFPYLLPLLPLLAFIPIAIQSRRAARRRAKGLCPACGYPLTDSIKCPECGHIHEAASSAPHRTAS